LQIFENTVNPILTKPKPKADPPPPPLVNKNNDSAVNKDGQEDNTSKQEQRDEKMDVE
jgi:hypothetical protein